MLKGPDCERSISHYLGQSYVSVYLLRVWIISKCWAFCSFIIWKSETFSVGDWSSETNYLILGYIRWNKDNNHVPQSYFTLNGNCFFRQLFFVFDYTSQKIILQTIQLLLQCDKLLLLFLRGWLLKMNDTEVKWKKLFPFDSGWL